MHLRLRCKRLHHSLLSMQPILGSKLYRYEGLCTDLVRSPAEKLCLLNGSWIDPKRICIAFKCYHVLRRGHVQAIERAQRTANFEVVHTQVYEIWFDVTLSAMGCAPSGCARGLNYMQTVLGRTVGGYERQKGQRFEAELARAMLSHFRFP